MSNFPNIHKPNGQPVPDPTPEKQLTAVPLTAEQIAAAERDGRMFVDLLVKMEMGDAALLAAVTAMLGSFRFEDFRIQVSQGLMMLSGIVLQDPAVWACILGDHLDAAQAAVRQRDARDAPANPNGSK